METFFIYAWFSFIFMAYYMLQYADKDAKFKGKLIIILICLCVGWLMLPVKLAQTIYKIDNIN